ncbi:MAG: transposase [Verrucomicrobiae bacterium]|nr:transposase [Verrucomicrobiae bacterium]
MWGRFAICHLQIIGNKTVDFLPFDPDVEISRSRRRLPHWFQNGRTYFVTFRLADSLPKSVRETIAHEKEIWLKQHGLSSRDEIKLLPAAKQDQFRNRFTRRIESLLDQGLGNCALRTPENAKLVADAFHFFDGERYRLDSFVIMPNHVHLLVCPQSPHFLSTILQSWKRHTARQINLRLGKTGSPFWLDENFDHIVRNSDQLERFRRYIAENPVKAGLREGEFLFSAVSD